MLKLFFVLLIRDSNKIVFFSPKDDNLGVLKSIASTCVGMCMLGGCVGVSVAGRQGRAVGRVRGGRKVGTMRDPIGRNGRAKW